MPGMPRLTFPHLKKEVTRHGKIVWYVRRKNGPRIRVRGEYGSPEFMAAYIEALNKQPARKKEPLDPAGTLSWLITRYRDSLAWNKLAEGTRRYRVSILNNVIEKAGDIPLERITRQKIAEACDARAKTPFAAQNFLKTMRGLFGWAAGAGIIASDPTAGLRAQVPRTSGFHSWTMEEIAKFEARWPIGTRERLAFALLLYTGLRRADVARLGRQHIRDGVISLRTSKTGEAVEIPVVPELQAIIDATPVPGLALVGTESGGHYTPTAFGNWFADACREAGAQGRAHGLRKAGAAIRAENGATEAELRSLYGWSDKSREPGRYTRAANRGKLAREAAAKIKRGEP